MQKKVFRILATDFFCWFPISLMAMLSIAGVPISNTAYAVSAIVLLPINSALNPILFSNAIDIVTDTIRGKKALKHVVSNAVQRTSSASRRNTLITPVSTAEHQRNYTSVASSGEQNSCMNVAKEGIDVDSRDCAQNLKNHNKAQKRLDLEDVSL